MEAKVARDREDLFRKYTRSLERRVEEAVGDRVGQGAELEVDLLCEAGALLGAYQVDPSQRFRLVRFYEMAKNALRTLRRPGLRGLERAFATLETICVNLLLFPWKKEFRCIKTFTGPYVYYLQGALCETDLRALLRLMGYSRDQDMQFQACDHQGGPAHLRQLAFELFLARAECRLLAEAVALAGRGEASEVEAVEARQNGVGLAREVSRLSLRGGERAGCLRRPSVAVTRPSRSVDVTDSAGSWQPHISRPVLRTSLSLRKEPLLPDPEEDQEPIIRPGPAPSPAPSPATPEPHFYLCSLADVDLYTECELYRQPSSRPPSRDSWGLMAHGGGKCQGCGRGCPSASLECCQRCPVILCPSCHAQDPPPCCGRQPSPRPLHSYLPAQEKLSVYSKAHGHGHSHTPLPEKPLAVPKPYLGKPLAGGDRARCGFCNRSGASRTCISCSKVSCDSCVGLYARDVCTRHTPQHTFVSNQQLNYKASAISHKVYH
ncbi:hypothetical protein AAFF_G00145150 [Aldrovandia affinis]|uniref:Spermatogenesis-associated protein 2 PUB-like domain-containing protein n=1 Tax=Aldrovandia affinis TaxID=143900 RepID=A0AAD7T1F0_9TELE|nr:hypothetical protein AAFF_G00145150 [Aldrovandia affinis]